MTAVDKNDFTLWQKLKREGGSPLRESAVSTGYWKLSRGSTGTATPLATWAEGTVWLVERPGKRIDSDDDEWPGFVAKTWPQLTAVEEDHYHTAFETGFWPDGKPVEKRDAPKGNEPPSDDDLLALAKEAIENGQKLIKAGAAKSASESDLGSSAAKTLTETRAKVEAAHKVVKQPILEESRKIDRKYLDVAKLMYTVAADVKAKVVEPWLVAEKARLQAIVDQQRAEEEAARAMGQVDVEPEKPAEPIKVSSGGIGRKVKLVSEKYAVVADPTKFADYLIRMKHQGFADYLLSIANSYAGMKNVSAGDETFPGVQIKTRDKAV